MVITSAHACTHAVPEITLIHHYTVCVCVGGGGGGGNRAYMVHRLQCNDEHYNIFTTPDPVSNPVRIKHSSLKLLSCLLTRHHSYVAQNKGELGRPGVWSWDLCGFTG